MIAQAHTVRTEITAQLATEWSGLCDEGASSLPFLRPDWFTTFAGIFDKRMELVTVKVGGRLRALLPLERNWGSLHGIPVRKLQGVFNLNTQRFDLVHGPLESEKREIVGSVWEALSSRSDWDIIEFRLVPEGSWLAHLLTLAEREGHRTGKWKMDAAPYIELGGSDEPEGAFSRFFGSTRRHLRQELDRRLRRLGEQGEVEFAVTQDASSEILSRYFDLEARGWKGRRGTAVTDDIRVERLHREFASNLSAKNALLVYELTLDRKTIAMSLNFRDGGRVVHWKTSYDEDFSRYAPGNLLFRRLLTDCIEQRVSEIDLLSPSTPNKCLWATGQRETAALYIFRRGFVGRLLWLWKFGIVGWLRAMRTGSAFGDRASIQVER